MRQGVARRRDGSRAMRRRRLRRLPRSGEGGVSPRRGRDGVIEPAISGGLLAARGDFAGEPSALGATLPDAMPSGDRLSFTAAPPSRVRAAPVAMTAVTGFTPAGAPARERRNVDLAPSSREKRLGRPML